MTIEELALRIAKEQGSDALNDWMGLSEMLADAELDDSDSAIDALATLVHDIHARAWALYASATVTGGDPARTEGAA